MQPSALQRIWMDRIDIPHLCLGDSNQDEPFSRTSCETCGNPLHGTRHQLASINCGSTEAPEWYSSCSDCLYYVANGDLPDDEHLTWLYDAEDLADFQRAYIECALWASTDDDGDPLDRTHSVWDLSPEARRQMDEDSADFFFCALPLLQQTPNWATFEQHGHDFWLTRNRHGAGFWDRGFPADLGRQLTDLSHPYGECDLYVGDDGRIHLHG